MKIPRMYSYIRNKDIKEGIFVKVKTAISKIFGFLVEKRAGIIKLVGIFVIAAIVNQFLFWGAVWGVLDFIHYCDDTSVPHLLGYETRVMEGMSESEVIVTVSQKNSTVLDSRQEDGHKVLYLDATKRCKQWASGINYYLNYRDKAVRVEFDDEGHVISIQLADCDEVGINS